jgi:cytochrome c oxidase subunit III
MNAPATELAYNRRNKIPATKFALWVACASIVMMFAALTSSYIVRRAAGNWLEFPLPKVFLISTIDIVLSSIALHFAYRAFKNGQEMAYKILLSIALVLGFAFLLLQYQGWMALQDMGVMMTTNPSGSFVYVISGLHAAHILGGIGALVVAVLHAFLLPFRVTAPRKLRFELTLTYWHFVDFLWVYLFFFFITQS